MKRVLLVILSLIVLCTLSGCGKDKAVTVEPPENGWTHELLDKTIYINGINYDYPVKWGDLKKKYTYKVTSENPDGGYIFFHYKNANAFSGSLLYKNTVSDSSEMDFAIFINNESGSKIQREELVSVNGLRLNDTYDDMIEKLGEPDYAYEDQAYRFGENTYQYFIDGEAAVTIYFFASDRIEMIMLKWNK